MLGRNVGIDECPVVVQEHRFDAVHGLELCGVSEVQETVWLFVKV